MSKNVQRGLNSRAMGSTKGGSYRNFTADSIPGFIVRKIEQGTLLKIKGGDGLHCEEKNGELIISLNDSKNSEKNSTHVYSGSTDLDNAVTAGNTTTIHWNHTYVELGTSIQTTDHCIFHFTEEGLYEVSARLSLNISKPTAMGAMRIEYASGESKEFMLLSQILVAYTGNPIPLVIPDLRIYSGDCRIRVTVTNVGLDGKIQTLPHCAENSLIIKRLLF